MGYLENYNYWKNHKDLDPSLKEELNSLTDKQIEDAFFSDLQFQTAGLRGLMGVGSNRLNIHTVRKATQGLANYLIHNNKHSVAIAYDNRYNSKEFAFDSARLLASNGLKVYIFDSLRPTPELSFTVRFKNCDAGIMITASHNPKEYNGYKIYDETGCQFIPELAKLVKEEIDHLEDVLSIKPNKYDESLIEIINDEVDEAYYENVLSIRFRKDLPNKEKMIIAFSPEHGASNIPIRTVLKKAGYHVEVVEKQAIPDPAFSNTKTPNPEEKGAYEGVLELAKEKNADLILVSDPDGDRMGVGVKHKDDYIIFNGNQTGAILLEYVLSSYKEMNLMPENPCIFNTIVTSDIGKEVARYYGVDSEQTLTGFKYIGNKVRIYEKKHEKNYVFGYEESYGSLIKPFVRDKDATQACLMLAEACLYYLNQGKTLQDVIEDVYKKIGAYYDSQVSFMFPGADGAVKMKLIMDNIRVNPLSIPGYDVIKIEDYMLQKTTQNNQSEPLLGHDKSDVLKYFLSDGSFFAIRPSGTEPKVKIYFSVKADTFENAKKKDEELTIILKNKIQ